MSYKFNDDYISISITEIENLKIKINGYVKNADSYYMMELLAPNPIIKGMSLNGSGLPFPNPQVAFGETVNYHEISENGIINDIIFKYPNGYYVVGGKNKIPPSVFVILHPKNKTQPLHIRLELNDNLPLHTLNYRPNFFKGPEFYSSKEELIKIEGSENTARDYTEAKIKYDIA